MPTGTEGESHLVERVRERIYRECDAGQLLADDAAADGRIELLARGFLAEERRVLPAGIADRIVQQVVAATTGLGPLEPLLADPGVSEVMVNGADTVFVERDGRVEVANVRFADDEHLRQVIDRILAPIGRRVDALSPMVDARLPDGSRVNAILPPLAVDGPALTIRRFLRVARTIDDLARLGTVSPEARAIIEHHVSSGSNVVVAGPTSSGKTTLLAASLALCDERDRIIVIEDAAELPIDNPHRVRLEARPATFEAAGEVRVRDLLRNALRMRPDRIVVGEVRGGEAFDLVQALSTGHRGCWSTVHANGVEDALLRIEAMALCADVAMPQQVLRMQIARAVDAVIFVDRDRAGARRVHSIATVDPSGGDWRLTSEYGA
jgi:pilus assembly protein CpaF